MKEIFIIRHGETDYNKNGLIQGSGIDIGLNEHGKMQSKLFYEYYKNESFDKIYVSQLCRARETVFYFKKYTNIPIEELSGLNEMNWGIHEGKEIDFNIRTIYGELIQEWSNGNFDKKPLNGESLFEVKERQKKAIDYILSKQNEKKVLLCIHGRALRIMLCNLLEVGMQKMQDFPHQNLSLYKLIYNGNKFKLVEFNNIKHLNGKNQNICS